MKEWNGRTILATACAKLIPPSLLYPDCLCILLATEDYIYVLEDNFDGSYITHFSISVNRIQWVKELVVKHTTQGGNSPPGIGTAIVQELLCAVAEMLYVDNQVRYQRALRYLKICYMDATGEHVLEFQDFQTSIRKFVRVCKGLIKQRME